MLTWKTDRDGDVLKVIFEGDVTERAPLDKLVGEISGPSVIFDVGEITRFNSMGVKNWLNLMSSLSERSIRVILERCAVPVVHQMNMISGFEGTTGGCNSVFVPYYCEDCHREDRMLLEMGANLVESIPESIQCSKCKQDMEFDDLHEHYERLVQLFVR